MSETDKLPRSSLIWLIACMAAAFGGASLLLLEGRLQPHDLAPWGANFLLLGCFGAVFALYNLGLQAQRAALSFAALTVAFGAALLIVEPYAQKWAQVDTGFPGAVFLGAGVVGLGAIGIAWLVAARARNRPATGVTPSAPHPALRALVSLSAAGVIAVYLFLKLATLIRNDDGTDFPLQVALGTALFALTTFAVELCALRLLGPAPVEDEASTRIKGRAIGMAHGVLQFLLVGFIVQIGFGSSIVLPESRSILVPTEVLRLSSPVILAHALLGAVVISQVVRYAVEVWSYRAGQGRSRVAKIGAVSA